MKDIKVPINLEKDIFRAINREKRKLALLHFTGAGTAMLASLVGVVPAVMYLIKTLRTSGFYEYLSLLSSMVFSDGAHLAAYWKEFSLSLAESLPFIAVTFLLGLIGIFIWSFISASTNVKTILASQ